jgi:hypothetical protein
MVYFGTFLPGIRFSIELLRSKLYGENDKTKKVVNIQNLTDHKISMQD